jgi:hypothetical protein
MQHLTQEVKNTITEMVQGLHTAIPGKIVKYDPAKCEAEVLPYGKFKKPDGSFLDFPQLNHVPVYFMQSMGQKLTVVYAINPGDECLILSQEQTLDTWRGSGAESNNDLRFDLTNSIALVGLFSKPNELCKRAQDNESIIVQRKDTYIEIYGTTEQIDVFAKGDINVETEKNINVKAAMDINVEAAQNITVKAAQNIDVKAAQNITITADGTLDIKSTGPMTVTSDASITMKAPRIDLNP